ncbi:hypothetical protein AALO_G00086910, partial [Alosa alosa]
PPQFAVCCLRLGKRWRERDLVRECPLDSVLSTNQTFLYLSYLPTAGCIPVRLLTSVSPVESRCHFTYAPDFSFWYFKSLLIRAAVIFFSSLSFIILLLPLVWNCLTPEGPWMSCFCTNRRWNC